MSQESTPFNKSLTEHLERQLDDVIKKVQDAKYPLNDTSDSALLMFVDTIRDAYRQLQEIERQVLFA